MPPFPLVPLWPSYMGAGLCDGEGERAFTIYDLVLGGEKYLTYFKRFPGAIILHSFQKYSSLAGSASF